MADQKAVRIVPGGFNEKKTSESSAIMTEEPWMDRCPPDLQPSIRSALERLEYENKTFPQFRKGEKRFELDFKYNMDNGCIETFNQPLMDMQRETTIGSLLFSSSESDSSSRSAPSATNPPLPDFDSGGMTLLIMMKNEDPILTRLLDSLRPYARSYIVLDTLSDRDASPESVRRLLTGIPGTIYSMPMIDFGTGRTCLAHLAHQHRLGFRSGDSRWTPVYRWGILMDGDYLLDVAREFQSLAAFEGYLAKMARQNIDEILLYTAENYRYIRPHIINMDVKWTYNCRTHEAVGVDWTETNRFRRMRMGRTTWNEVRIDHRSDGRNKDNKYWRDLVWLMMDRINRFDVLRSEFYGGNTGLTVGKQDISVFLHDMRIKRRGWREEDYWTARQYAQGIYAHPYWSGAPSLLRWSKTFNAIYYGAVRDALRLESWTDFFQQLRKDKEFPFICSIGAFFLWNDKPPMSEELFVEQELHSVSFPNELLQASLQCPWQLPMALKAYRDLDYTAHQPRDFVEHVHHRLLRRTTVLQATQMIDTLYARTLMQQCYAMTLPLQQFLFQCGLRLFRNGQKKEAYHVWKTSLQVFVFHTDLPVVLRTLLNEWKLWSIADWQRISSDEFLLSHPLTCYRYARSLDISRPQFPALRAELFMLPNRSASRPTEFDHFKSQARRLALQSRHINLSLYLVATDLQESLWTRLSYLIDAWKWMPDDAQSVESVLSQLAKDAEHPSVTRMIYHIQNLLIRAFPRGANQDRLPSSNRRRPPKNQLLQPALVLEFADRMRQTYEPTSYSDELPLRLKLGGARQAGMERVDSRNLLYNRQLGIFYRPNPHHHSLQQAKILIDGKNNSQDAPSPPAVTGSTLQRSLSLWNGCRPFIQYADPSEMLSTFVASQAGDGRPTRPTVCKRSDRRDPTKRCQTFLQHLLQTGSLSQMYRPLPRRFDPPIAGASATLRH
jgi:hypothetical protein